MTLLLFGLSLSPVARSQHISLKGMRPLIELRYPDVRWMSQGALLARLTTNQNVLLLDAREVEEFTVSHLRGAIRVSPRETRFERFAAFQKTLVVVYCSVGYRSAEIVKRMQLAGFENVYNLEGGIFAWANENRPMVSQHNKPTSLVHPYDALWGKLVDPSKRANK